MKINWKRKLSSRKFWLAIIGFLTPLLLAFGVSDSAAAEIAAIVIAGADVIIYIAAEGAVDAASKTGNEYDWE